MLIFREGSCLISIFYILFPLRERESSSRYLNTRVAATSTGCHKAYEFINKFCQCLLSTYNDCCRWQQYREQDTVPILMCLCSSGRCWTSHQIKSILYFQVRINAVEGKGLSYAAVTSRLLVSVAYSQQAYSLLLQHVQHRLAAPLLHVLYLETQIDRAASVWSISGPGGREERCNAPHTGS